MELLSRLNYASNSKSTVCCSNVKAEKMYGALGVAFAEQWTGKGPHVLLSLLIVTAQRLVLVLKERLRSHRVIDLHALCICSGDERNFTASSTKRRIHIFDSLPHHPCIPVNAQLKV